MPVVEQLEDVGQHGRVLPARRSNRQAVPRPQQLVLCDGGMHLILKRLEEARLTQGLRLEKKKEKRKKEKKEKRKKREVCWGRVDEASVVYQRSWASLGPPFRRR